MTQVYGCNIYVVREGAYYFAEWGPVGPVMAIRKDMALYLDRERADDLCNALRALGIEAEVELI